MSDSEEAEDDYEYEDDQMCWDVVFDDGKEARRTEIDFEDQDADENFFLDEPNMFVTDEGEVIRGCDLSYGGADIIEDAEERIKACSLSSDIKKTKNTLEQIMISAMNIDQDNLKSIFDKNPTALKCPINEPPPPAASFNMLGYIKGQVMKKLQRQVLVNCYEGEQKQQKQDDDEFDVVEMEEEAVQAPKQLSSVSISLVDEKEVGKCAKNTNYGPPFIWQPSTKEFERAQMTEVTTYYCLSLLRCEFQGQASSEQNDTCDAVDGVTFHLGKGLCTLDGYLRKFDPRDKLLGQDAYYTKLLQQIAKERTRGCETEDECFERLMKDSNRFLELYKERANHPKQQPWNGYSQPIVENDNYWGTWQQLLSGKVIGDWIDRKNGPIDPVFGVLLHPTTGRAGKGDNKYFHQIVYDNNGKFAYHSAVHDAFGYLIDVHECGPGYNYINRSVFSNYSPLAGQVYGVKFWKKALEKLPLEPELESVAKEIGTTVFGKKKEVAVY